MSKILLIAIGIICAVLITAGMLWYNHLSALPRERLSVSTQLMPADPEEATSLSTAKTTFDPQAVMPDAGAPITPFIIPGRIYLNQYRDTLTVDQSRAIENPALDYINKIIKPADKAIGIRAEAQIKLTADSRTAKYTLRIYQKQSDRNSIGGFGYNLILRKTGAGWAIIDVRGNFIFRQIIGD